MKTKSEFIEKVSVADSGCWHWNGARKKSNRANNDYGFVFWDGKQMLAHRVSYQIHIGVIPPGINVCHKCDIPYCVNPDHLFLGTQYENIMDMVAKGRHAKAGPISDQLGEKNRSAKLNEKQVAEIRSLYPIRGITDLSKAFNVGLACIHDIVNFKTWKHVI